MFIPLSKNYKIRDFFTTPLIIILIFSFLAVNFAMYWDNRKKAKYITVIMPDKTIRLKTISSNVREALEGSGISINNDYIVIPGLDSKIYNNSIVKLIRRKTKILIENEIIYPDSAIIRETKFYPYGKKVIVQDSKEGLEKKYYQIIYYDNKPVIKRLIKKELVIPPKRKIVLIGCGKTKDVFKKKNIPDDMLLYIPEKGYMISDYYKKNSENFRHILFLK